MGTKEPKRSIGSGRNTAVTGWDNARTQPQQGRDQAAALAKEEEHVLRCLGAAVIMQWNDLSTEVQRELFDHATSMGELRHIAELKGQIARFLKKHKDGRCRPGGRTASEGEEPIGSATSMDVTEFSYRRRAGVFAPDAGSGILAFHRFATLAEAVRFVVEELSPADQTRAFIDVDDHTLGSGEIRALYDHRNYPLPRTRGRLVA